MTVNICTGVNTRYRARARYYGCRNYVLIGTPTKSYKLAIQRMAAAFADNPNYKRADVMVLAEYYDPLMVCELVRR